MSFLRGSIALWALVTGVASAELHRLALTGGRVRRNADFPERVPYANERQDLVRTAPPQPLAQAWVAGSRTRRRRVSAARPLHSDSRRTCGDAIDPILSSNSLNAAVQRGRTRSGMRQDVSGVAQACKRRASFGGDKAA